MTLQAQVTKVIANVVEYPIQIEVNPDFITVFFMAGLKDGKILKWTYDIFLDDECNKQIHDMRQSLDEFIKDMGIRFNVKN